MKEIDILRELEATGKYLFHGTATDNINLFEPRQAMSHGQKDGTPCVAASEYADPAIFMAIFSGRVSCGWDSNGSNFGFHLKKSDYDEVKTAGWSGFVYVFDRSEFKPYAVWEWRTTTRVSPMKKLSVTFADLPSEIDLT